MSEPQDPNPSQHKDDLADALSAMSAGAEIESSNDESEGELLTGFESTGRALRPEAPQLSAPARPIEPEPIEPSSFDEIVEDENVAVPAPLEAMLAGQSVLHSSAPRGHRQSSAITLQRTIIPIFLTLSLLLPGLGIWMKTLPEESQVRATMQNWPMYLFIAGALALILAIVNMMQVRSRQNREMASA